METIVPPYHGPPGLMHMSREIIATSMHGHFLAEVSPERAAVEAEVQSEAERAV